MFTQSKTINSERTELANFIKDQDIFNSRLLERMSQPGLTRIIYTVISDLRPDLVAKDFYGSEDYLGILLLQVEPNLLSFEKGSVLKLLPKETIDTFITNL